MPTQKEICEVWAAQGGLPGDLSLCSSPELGKICWGCWRPLKGRRQERAHIRARAGGGDNNDPLNYFLLCKNCHLDQPDGLDMETQLAWLGSVPCEASRIIAEIQRQLDDACRTLDVLPEHIMEFFDGPLAPKFPASLSCFRSDRRTMISNVVWAAAKQAKEYRGVGQMEFPF